MPELVSSKHFHHNSSLHHALIVHQVAPPVCSARSASSGTPHAAGSPRAVRRCMRPRPFRIGAAVQTRTKGPPRTANAPYPISGKWPRPATEHAQWMVRQVRSPNSINNERGMWLGSRGRRPLRQDAATGRLRSGAQVRWSLPERASRDVARACH